MPRRTILLLAALAVFATAATALAIFLATRIRPVTAADLAGEWVQDPGFLQNTTDLDAQKREIDHWENYEFAFQGSRLTAWRLVFDDAKRDDAGWAQPGQGAHFDSDYTLASGAKTTLLKFTDETRTPREAKLAREDAGKLTVTLDGRTFRLQKAPAENLRTRKLIAAP